jgi:DNA-binding NtrC family response regulator
MANILVVDDELGIRELLADILNDEGHTVSLAENAAQARLKRLEARPDLVLLDIWMPDTDGVSLLKEWAASRQLTMPVVMMSGHATIETAVEATKIGAQSFLEKPITLAKLLKAVSTALASPLKSDATLAITPTKIIQRNQNAQTVSQDLQETWAKINLSVPDAVPLAAIFLHEQQFDLRKPLREARDGFEKAYFEFHLAQERGSMTRVAEKTGLERTHLYRKLKHLGVDVGRDKK